MQRIWSASLLVTTRGSLGLSYDAAGMPIGMSGQAAASYTYDGNQKRVKSVVNGVTTYSVYSSLTGQISMIDEVGTADRFSTVNLGPVSIRRYADGNLEYIWHDHLGSPVSGSGPTGSVLWRESYYPFGQKWQATLNRDKPSFTGHVEDSATGLTYMQARYYDPVLGRFLAPDPVGFAEGGVRYFNRYAYTANDPVNATDPTGMCSTGSRAGGDASGCKFSGAPPPGPPRLFDLGGGTAKERFDGRQSENAQRRAEGSGGMGGPNDALFEGMANFQDIMIVSGDAAANAAALLTITGPPVIGALAEPTPAGEALLAGAASRIANGGTGKLSTIADDIGSWLGPGATVNRSPTGNLVVTSADRLRVFRMDFNQVGSGRFLGPHAQFGIRSHRNRRFETIEGVPQHIYFGGP